MKKLLITFSFITFVFCGIQDISAQKVNTTSNQSDRDVVITETPQPDYTNAARDNSVEGTITARVTFKADGTIGKIFLVTLLPHGLNQKAIEAAKKIKFLPAVKNGIPITVVKQIEYNFKLIGKGFGGGFGDGVGNGVGRGKGSDDGVGNGTGGGLGNNTDNVVNDTTTPRKINSNPAKITRNLLIRSKPRPSYTDLARQNNIQGTVLLKVYFKANGIIGKITPIKTLPFGLTEQAIVAARKIQFDPAMKKGKTITVHKILEFTFTIY